MAGVSIDLRIQDQGVARAFTRLASAVRDTTPIMGAIGTGLVASTNRRFVSQTSPAGAGWAALNPGYKATKRKGRILTESGRLRGSVTSRPGRDEVRVGTNVIYAAIHQFGGTIKPKAGGRLVFRLASGPVFARSVTLPARPFLGISGDDREMVADVVFGALDRAMR